MKYLAKVSYNGAAYFGFQRQTNHPSIQNEIERALGELCGEPTLIKAAGRTDAGVHALGQRFSFSCSNIRDIEKFRIALNRLLPVDISILEIKEVPDSFDARHSSIKKVYLYKFSYGEKRPIEATTIAQLGYYPFDEKAFRDALSYFVGKHDFSNFTTKKEDVGDFIRTIDSIDIDIDRENRLGNVTFLGDGFMTYMIRLIMGCAFKCAHGQIKTEEVPILLDAKPRHIVSYKASAAGLYLKDVIYE